MPSLRNTAWILLLLPCIGFAQQFTPLKDAVPSNATLLQLGDRIILIHQLDQHNAIQKWVTFDSGLHILSAKKIFTPESQHLISQNYFTTPSAVIRVDQTVFNDSLYVTLFRFDASGKLQRVMQLSHQDGKKLEPLPFYVAQSPDKKMLALVQSMTQKKDELTFTSFVVSESLDISSNSQRVHSFDMLVYEMLLPVADNNGGLYIPIADKFDSYRLGSTLQLLPMHDGSDPVTIRFDRKKLKDTRLQAVNGLLHISALYSLEENKSEVAGLLDAQVILKNGVRPSFTYHVYDEAMKKSVAKRTANAARKGNPMNYLYQLPVKEKVEDRSFAVLLADQMPMRVQNNGPVVPNASEELDNLKRQVAAVNSLTNSRRRGPFQATSPMTPAEASVYAATVQRTVGNENTPLAQPEQTGLPTTQKSDEQQLLQFTYASNSDAVSYQLLRVKMTNDAIYDFFTFAEAGGQYFALQYKLPTLKRAQFVSTTLSPEGKPVERILFEDKTRVIMNGYPTLVYQGKKMVAVYADRLTNEMGVVGVDLR